MGVETQKFIRKPLYVDAVRVTPGNFDEIAAWCQGEIQTEEHRESGTTKKFIKIRVHNPKGLRQTKAFIGDWVLYTERGYKVYLNKPFRAAFDPVEGAEPKVEEIAAAEEQPASAEEIREKLPNVQDRRPKVIEEADIKEINVVAEEPSQGTGVQPIQSVRPGDDLGTTPQGEPIEVVEATPQTIADAVNENEQARLAEGAREFAEEDAEIAESVIAPEPTPAIVPPEIVPEPVSEQPPEVAAAGKAVLSEEEQQAMGPEKVRELVSTGEVILAQDLKESA